MKELTPMLIETLRTPAGGFNRDTMDALGIPWPLERGWIVRAAGLKVSDRNWKRAQKASREQRHIFRGNTRRK